MKTKLTDGKALVKKSDLKNAVKFDPMIRRIEELKRIEKRDNIYSRRLKVIKYDRLKKKFRNKMYSPPEARIFI